MDQQPLPPENRRRSSVSTIGCSDESQINGTQPHSANSSFKRGNSSKSFHNFGRNHRISCYTGHQPKNFRGSSLDMESVTDHSFLADSYSPGYTDISKSGYRNDGLFEVSINKLLLEPLYLGVDPHDHQVKVHEKDQMKDLNTQFASFIDKVRSLEQRNKMLVTKWELLQNQKLPMVKKDLSILFENYIANLRKKNDYIFNEKNKLENQQRIMQELIEEYQNKYKEESSRKEHLENEFVLLKQKVDNEFKQQKELELKRELLMENKEFLKYFFMEERAVLHCHPSETAVVLNMDNSRDLDMDILIKNIDCWYQNVAQRSKEEANLFYQNQIEDLQNKKCQCNESLQKTNSEITELNRVIHLMQCKVDAEKKKTAALQIGIGDVEHKGDRAMKDARAKQTDLQNRIQNSKDQLAVILRDYQDLMNTKLALDIEIATYKTMLEGEENRIRRGGTVRMALTNSTYPQHNMNH
ncbi:keratin, type II cytoskeletal 5-like [Ahaetulla prasina]|uniref:keratin, type II cytoskeletal 5-like n=1 Tax=Ahaetulla prasina TaxID=499056 RepID=UPI0026488736|nr:keratin, type II cytoskeletal 5-like [Ahaetulla prasina]